MMYEAVDGLYYKYPQYSTNRSVVIGSEDWNVMFLYLHHKSRIGSKRTLKELGFQAQPTETAGQECIFADGTIAQSRVFQLYLTGPIPVPKNHRGHTSIPEKPYLCWTWCFPVDAILYALMDNPSEYLEDFLGPNYKAAIRRQIPFLVGARITNLNFPSYHRQLTDRFGATVRLRRKEAHEALTGL